MSKKSLPFKDTFAIGLMLFALFLGAGNMIFPPFLGQEAGANMWKGILGFLITGVGLPLLGVIAIAKTGGDLQLLASRVSLKFGVVFTVIMYLAIGPFFGIPRTGTVAFEIAISPFLNEGLEGSSLPLALFTIIFFSLTAWLSMNPTKLVDRIGKILTPALLIILAILVSKSLISPMGEPLPASKEYATGPVFKGFIEGYLTMDTIAALVFGIVVITAIKDLGVKSEKSITKICIQAGFIAAAGLTLVYLALAYIGATSPQAIGMQENGGAILSASTTYLYGTIGKTILALAILFACITTSVGLVSSCAQYFHKLMPNVSYRLIVIVLSIFSMFIANIGLTQLIKVSLPVLIMIYPIAIVLIFLSFAHSLFNGYSIVYYCSLIPTGVLSVMDGLNVLGIQSDFLSSLFSKLPLFNEGIGWIVPAIIGAIIGYILAILFRLAGKAAETTKA
ncbi:LIVCS family branched-chain amino acid:cation transporter [Oikeobacillus pervagus]|uniref:Branched-chain amino acid transport system carrier protein n=1 Tax=Oikeobacillus pervagus TaxID=1325931 RepID=A0AAJ1T4E4_9BACI|nr:branched-chain amino acid transport system II carrier protein [Oikeobacillus pervagus]MDQ0215016.1 LIVCS family branched-chain amino acid:cation transporter [Oikeobacillus pervagus]